MAIEQHRPTVYDAFHSAPCQPVQSKDSLRQFPLEEQTTQILKTTFSLLHGEKAGICGELRCHDPDGPLWDRQRTRPIPSRKTAETFPHTAAISSFLMESGKRIPCLPTLTPLHFSFNPQFYSFPFQKCGCYVHFETDPFLQLCNV